MFASKTSYSLRVFTDPQKDRNDLVAALSIYTKHTPTSQRTSSNEMVYWLEHYNKQFSDSLFLFGFYRNDEVVGFAEFAFFTKERLLILDYLTMSPEYRRYSTFSEFLDQVIAYFEREGIEYDFIVAEVLYSQSASEPTEDSKIWIQLLRLHGFRLAQAPYYQPQLGTLNFESATPGGLMISCSESSSSIRRETYILIVRTLLLKHYARWYHPFMGDDHPTYVASLKRMYDDIGKSLSATEVVIVNGETPLLSPTPLPPDSSPHIGDFILPSTVIIVLLVAVMAVIMVVLKVSVSTAGVMFLTALITYLAIVATISTRAFRVFDRLLRFVRRTSQPTE